MTINGIEYLTINEAAKYLGLQPNRVRQLVSGTKTEKAIFDRLKVGNTNLIPRQQVMSYKERRS